MVPISVRTADQHGALGNQVSAMMATLPVWCQDPLERLRGRQRVDGRPQVLQAGGRRDVLTELTDFAPPTIVGQAARLQSRQRWFNLVVTNVPGPQFPLYLLGRQLLEIFPMVPLAKRQAVCFGIMSYNGTVNFGLIGDYDAMRGPRRARRRPRGRDPRALRGGAGRDQAAPGPDSQGRKEGHNRRLNCGGFSSLRPDSALFCPRS